MLQLLRLVAAALGRRAAQHALDARDELPRVERLRQVVVGADLEPDDLVDVLVAGGQHQDRDVRGLAHAPADLDPVDVGQHQVEDDQRRRLGRDLGQRGAAVRDGAHVVARVLEVERDERGDRRLVLDDEDRLRASWPSAARTARAGSSSAPPEAAGSPPTRCGSRRRPPSRHPAVLVSPFSSTEPRPTAAERSIPAPRIAIFQPPPIIRKRRSIAGADRRRAAEGLVVAVEDERLGRSRGRQVGDHGHGAEVDPADHGAAPLEHGHQAAAVADRQPARRRCAPPAPPPARRRGTASRMRMDAWRIGTRKYRPSRVISDVCAP